MFRKRPDLLEEVLANIVRIYKDRTSTVQDLHKEFKRSDYDQKGKLAKEEFLNCLSNFGFKLRKETERDLVDSLTDYERERGTERGAKGVNYVDFISAVNAEHEADNNADDTMDMLKRRYIYASTYTDAIYL
jgi:Ca2+-binding EF-hand superfamily protein